MSRSPPKQSRVQKMVQRAEEIASDPKNGYSQKPPSGRWGPDYDCSSLMYEIAHYAGYSVETGTDKVRFTGTMLKDFEKAGFQILPFANVGISDLKIGDILLNLALHAEIYVGEGQSIGALSSETGGYVGESGDQTGQEIDKHPVITFDKGWDYVLRPPEDDDTEEDLEEEGDEEMPMNYNQPNQGMNPNWGTAPMAPMQYAPGNNGYPQGTRWGTNTNMGYPQGNLGQMNGYSQANAGGYQQGMMYGGPQGQSYQMETDYCFVKGIEGARNSYGIPNSRKPLFDEDKSIFYAVTYGPQGTPIDIHPYKFGDDFESMEEMPQHLSPLMHNQANSGMQMGEYITRAEFEELKEMINNAESSAKQQTRGNQQSGSKLNARTN